MDDDDDEMKQGDLDLGWEGAVEGMKRAAEHAERVSPGWQDRAMLVLQKFVLLHPDPFVAPEARKWAARQGLDAPPSNYAWGNVFKQAAKCGLIVAVGSDTYGDATMHTQTVRRWRAA